MEHDYILLDELAHNSLIMGVRMGRIPVDQVMTFQHNNIHDLREKLLALSIMTHDQNRITHGHDLVHDGQKEEVQQLQSQGEIIIVVESVYSMDGDIAPLKDILDLALEYNAKVVVDEAHGLGVFGKTNVSDLYFGQQQHNYNNNSVSLNDGNNNNHGEKVYGGTGVLAALNLESHPSLLASVYTFGKAAGCHGAVVISEEVTKQYLINYARPFVYSTSLPPHSLCTIQCAYESMTSKSGELLRETVFSLVRLFRTSIMKEFQQSSKTSKSHNDDGGGGDPNRILLESYSPIQAIICRGNERCIHVSKMLREVGPFDVFPIRSPTVPKGEERIRIILHAHNTEMEVIHLVKCLHKLMTHTSSRSSNEIGSQETIQMKSKKMALENSPRSKL